MTLQFIFRVLQHDHARLPEKNAACWPNRHQIHSALVKFPATLLVPMKQLSVSLKLFNNCEGQVLSWLGSHKQTHLSCRSVLQPLSKTSTRVGGKGQEISSKGSTSALQSTADSCRGFSWPSLRPENWGQCSGWERTFFFSCVKLIVSAKIRKIKKRASVALLKNKKKKKKALEALDLKLHKLLMKNASFEKLLKN